MFVQNPGKWRNRAVVPPIAPTAPLPPLPSGQMVDTTGFEPHLHPDNLPPSVPGHGSLLHELTEEQKSRKHQQKSSKPAARGHQATSGTTASTSSTASTASSAAPPGHASTTAPPGSSSVSGPASTAAPPGPSSVPGHASTAAPRSRTLPRGQQAHSTSSPFDGGELCSYVGPCGPISVTSQDYVRLTDGSFLNDTLVDTFNGFILNNSDPVTTSSIHIFSSTFLLCLSGRRQKPGSDLERREAEEALPMPERRHKRVARYTRNIDLFSKNVVVFPCCLDSPPHWFLVAALLGPQPCVVVLDSFAAGDGRREVADMIVEYLEMERSDRGLQGPAFTVLNPIVPQQEDGYNCGIFAIMFLERILAAPAHFSTLARQDGLNNWFFLSAVSGQRTRWADTLQWLSRQQNPRRARRFPAIRCEPPAQLQGLGCMLNLQRCCFTVSTILLMVRCGFDGQLDQTAVLSPAQEALVNALVGVATARRNPANPPMSPGPFIVAVNGLGLHQFQYNLMQECAVELLDTVLQSLDLVPGFLVSHQEVGTCLHCSQFNRQVQHFALFENSNSPACR